MIYNLPNEIIELIFRNSYNYDIFNLHRVCHKFYQIINDSNFIEFLQSRYHPIVFNSDDLYCHVCNFHIYPLILQKFEVRQTLHFLKTSTMKVPTVMTKSDHLKTGLLHLFIQISFLMRYGILSS